MNTLRDQGFQEILVNYPRPERVFYVAHEVTDQVASRVLIRDGVGKDYKPEDYLKAFERFVQENAAHIDAIRILLDRPQDWSCAALTELRQKLAATTERFTVENLQVAHRVRYDRALVDIISMVKHAIDDRAPLLTATERVGRAVDRVRARRSFTPDQERWLECIRAHLSENLCIDQEDFDLVPILSREGGWAAAQRAFRQRIKPLLRELNEAIAA